MTPEARLAAAVCLLALAAILFIVGFVMSLNGVLLFSFLPAIVGFALFTSVTPRR